MFKKCIREKVHPATWAVMGVKTDLVGVQAAHRGTAFAVDSGGHLLTCWHATFMDQEFAITPDYFEVLQPERDIQRVLRAELVARDKDMDLALLKLVGKDVATRPAQLNAGSQIEWGQSCCAFGHPLSISSGTNFRLFTRAAGGLLSMFFRAPRFENTRPIAMYEVDFFSHGGMSGGPLFLPNGCVFGVVSGSRMLNEGTGQAIRSNLSIAIDISEAIQFLQPLGIKLQLAGHVSGGGVSKKPKHGKASRRKRRGR